jgi:ferredoxin-NADP reductase
MKTAQNWMQATVFATRDLSPTVREFEIRPLEGAPLTYPPGAHLQMQVMVQAGAQREVQSAKVQTRSYSLTGAPRADTWRIAVKRMDDGRGGSKAMWRLAAGDRLMVSEPQNFFPLDLTAPGYLLVAGGIGITPRLAAHARATGVPVRMLYGARTADELVFEAALRQAFEGLQETGQAALQTFTGPAPIDFASEIAALPMGAQIYTCGPVPMLEALKLAWSDAGRPIADLRFETFGSSGRLPTQPFRLKLPRHGIDIMVPVDTTLLDALEQAGVPTISDCRRGECGLCAMDVLAVQGEIDHRDVFLSAHEKAACQRICVCVSRVAGEITLDSAWRPDNS